MIAVAILLIFNGNISPKSANKTGPTPKPYPRVAHITLIGNRYSLM